MVRKASEEKTIEIDGYRVDLNALPKISHQCRPEDCPKRGTCCEYYEITVLRGELARLTGMIPAAAKYQPRLRDQGSYVNPFEKSEPGCFVLDQTEHGRCVFAWRRRGMMLCSFHSAALELGVDPYRHKPRACAMWPLALGDSDPIWTLTIQDDCLRFPCNRRRRARGLDPGIAELIERNFGQAFLDKVQAALAGKPKP